MLKRLWLLLAQAVTLGVAAALVYQVFFTADHRSPAVEPRPANVERTPSAKTAAPPAGSFRGAVAKAAPSVVSIYTARPAEAGAGPSEDLQFADGEGGTAMGLGSGVIVSAKGLILTNNHVIEGAREIVVALPGGRPVEAKVLGADPETDLAVLKIAVVPNLRPVVFASADSAQVGDIVLALGNPFGVGQTVTQGIVSATGRNRLGINTFENFVQTDAAINPGNSGGALVDVQGDLIGINTAIFSRSGGSQGIGFAIPASLAIQVMDQIIAKGRVDRGWIGVAATDAKVERDGGGGAAITGVLRGGPAARAGIRPGDIVTAVNGKAIADTLALVSETAALAPGTRAQLTVVRGRDRNVVTVELGRRPPPQPQDGALPRP